MTDKATIINQNVVRLIKSIEAVNNMKRPMAINTMPTQVSVAEIDELMLMLPPIIQAIPTI